MTVDSDKTATEPTDEPRRRRRAASRPAGPPQVPAFSAVSNQSVPDFAPAPVATSEPPASAVRAPVSTQESEPPHDHEADPALEAEVHDDDHDELEQPAQDSALDASASDADDDEAPVLGEQAPENGLAALFRPPTIASPFAPPTRAAVVEPTTVEPARVPTSLTFQPPIFLAPEPAELPPAVHDGPLDRSDVSVLEEDLNDGDDAETPASRRRRRGGRNRKRRDTEETTPVSEEHTPQDEDADEEGADEAELSDDEGTEVSSRRRRRRRRRTGAGGDEESVETSERPVVRRRAATEDQVTGLKGSTRLEAKRQRRRESRDTSRRRPVVTEAEFLARRESVQRTMVVRQHSGRTQLAVLEDNILVEHFVARQSQASMIGNVYLGRVQNVLPSMEAAFVDIGKGRNAVLYAGEVNWDAAGLDGQPRKIESALKSGDCVLVQVTKDPVGHKGARLTSQVSLPGRFLVLVPGGSMSGISRRLPEPERARLKKILRDVVPEDAGVIVRTAAEGASEDELTRDVERLLKQWERVQAKRTGANAPALLHSEPDLTIKVIRDVFNEDFTSLVVAGDQAWDTVSEYVGSIAPDLVGRLEKWDPTRGDAFAHYRIDEQVAKALERKVYLPSGGSLVIDRTEAMTVVDVNTGKFVGSGGNLEATVTRNNLEAAEEIVRQIRLRDIGGIVVVDFIDMVLESNRDLVLRRLLECLARDRSKHQVAEVTSLGLVQMTRKRIGQGLLEVFSEPCNHCKGRGAVVVGEPIDTTPDPGQQDEPAKASNGRGASKRNRAERQAAAEDTGGDQRRAQQAAVVAQVAAATLGNGTVGHEDDQPVTADESAAVDKSVAVDDSAAVDETAADSQDSAQSDNSAEPVVVTDLPVAPRRGGRGRRRAVARAGAPGSHRESEQSAADNASGSADAGPQATADTGSDLQESLSLPQIDG